MHALFAGALPVQRVRSSLHVRSRSDKKLGLVLNGASGIASLTTCYFITLGAFISNQLVCLVELLQSRSFMTAIAPSRFFFGIVQNLVGSLDSVPSTLPVAGIDVGIQLASY